jgi:vanillate O-demethylase monooxygenase subunit
MTTDIAASQWPMNAWYAAAYDVEVGRRLTPVRVAGVPVILYRRLDGQPVALADACCTGSSRCPKVPSVDRPTPT